MLTVAHLSDLHFCSAELRPKLQDFSGRLSDFLKRLGIAENVAIHLASPTVLSDLSSALSREDPDIVVVSGDITAFGDHSSFLAFADWSAGLTTRAAGRAARQWILVPGNHDALQYHLSSLHNHAFLGLPAWLRLPLRLFLKHHLRPLRGHLPTAQAGYLHAFRECIANHQHLSDAGAKFPIPDCEGASIRFTPFSTTSTDPFWMNMAETRRNDWVRLTADLHQNATPGQINVVVAHHNPVSPPSGTEGRLSYGYNGMPEGTMFLAELQEAGVDLLLHGHHHEHSLFRFDFNLATAGHVFVLASLASSSEHFAGFNLLEFNDPNNGLNRQFVHISTRGFTSGRSMPLLFERHRPVDAGTLSARYELKHYVYQSNDASDERVFGPLQTNIEGIVYMAGRHFRSVRESRFHHLREVLSRDSGRIRLLLMDPELVRGLRLAGDSESVESNGDLWGRAEELDRLATEAEETLSQVRRFSEDLPSSHRSRIDVRVSHTLLPFGAYARYPDRPWGAMAVKMLPIGAIGDIHSPVLRLNRRVHMAMYDYYLRHLKYLLLKARVVCGDWSDQTDLREGISEDLLQAL